MVTILQKPRLIGEFEIRSGNVFVGDPCYLKYATDRYKNRPEKEAGWVVEENLFSNVRTGKWFGYVIKQQERGKYAWFEDGINARLITVHESFHYEFQVTGKLVDAKKIADSCVDSGQTGVFDIEYHGENYKDLSGLEKFIEKEKKRWGDYTPTPDSLGEDKNKQLFMYWYETVCDSNMSQHEEEQWYFETYYTHTCPTCGTKPRTRWSDSYDGNRKYWDAQAKKEQYKDPDYYEKMPAGAAILDAGINCGSFGGDGGYPIYVKKSKDKEIVGFEVRFRSKRT